MSQSDMMSILLRDFPLASRVVLDTSAIYAIASTSDDFHERASRTFKRLLDQQAELFTTSHIFLESYVLIQRRMGFTTLMTFVESIESLLDIVWIDEATHKEAWETMISKDGRRLSFV